MNENEKAFLIELTALSKKHGIAVDGCGCCGSPFLNTIDSAPDEAGYAINPGELNDLRWSTPKDWNWADNQKYIVR
jgi:hypothetical protein